MKRRELLIGVGACSAFVFSGERLGAQALRKARMGWLSGGLSGLEGNPLEAALKPSLEELGWKLGDTLEISERHAGGDFAGIPRLASRTRRTPARRDWRNGYNGSEGPPECHTANSRRLHASSRRSRCSGSCREHQQARRKHHRLHAKSATSLG